MKIVSFILLLTSCGQLFAEEKTRADLLEVQRYINRNLQQAINENTTFTGRFQLVGEYRIRHLLSGNSVALLQTFSKSERPMIQKLIEFVVRDTEAGTADCPVCYEGILYYREYRYRAGHEPTRIYRPEQRIEHSDGGFSVQEILSISGLAPDVVRSTFFRSYSFLNREKQVPCPP